MNERIEHCLYQAGLTAQGCWDELDDYARKGIEKFAMLIIEECCNQLHDPNRYSDGDFAKWRIHKHFGLDYER